jgi:hypothetical protein
MTSFQLSLGCLLLASQAHAQDFASTRETGPQSLVIAYRVKPERRVALRSAMEQDGVARFATWKQQGWLKDYRILFNSYLDSETYDLLCFLTFKDFSGVARWRQIERERPGGLPSRVLPLIQSAITYSLDAAFQGASPQAAAHGRSVFLIIPYDVLIPTGDYVKYAESYVVPQMKGWIEESVLAGFKIYITRYSTERPWGALFILEYRDNDSFGKRETTVAKVREKLKSSPIWFAASQNKQKIRVEKQTIIAEELFPH